ATEATHRRKGGEFSPRALLSLPPAAAIVAVMLCLVVASQKRLEFVGEPTRRKPRRTGSRPPGTSRARRSVSPVGVRSDRPRRHWRIRRQAEDFCQPFKHIRLAQQASPQERKPACFEHVDLLLLKVE